MGFAVGFLWDFMWDFSVGLMKDLLWDSRRSPRWITTGISVGFCPVGHV